MANMGYCRFQNTLEDMQDILEHFDDKLSKDEHEARLELLRICVEIAKSYEEDDLEIEDDGDGE